MKTKTFVILLIAIPLLLIAGGVYYFYKVSPKSPAQNLPPAAEEVNALQIFVNEPVISPILSFSGETVWFMTKEGKMFRQSLTADSEKEEYLLPEPVEGLKRVIWQKDGSDFIVEQNLDGHTRYQFFDSANQKFVPYPVQMRNPRFLAGDKKIVYDWVRADGGHELKVSDLDGGNFQKITDLFRPDYELEASPRLKEVVLFVSDPGGRPPSKIFLADLNTGRFRDLGEEAAYEGVKFSPDGSVLLAAKITSLQGAPSLVAFYLDALTRKDFPGISVLSIDEATWSENGTEIIIGGKEGFTRLSLVLGESKEIYRFETHDLAPSPRDLIWHSAKSFLLFRDERTGYLYKLDLK